MFTTKEEALKPGYRGTPEPLYDGPVLTDDREAQPVAEYGDAYQGAREDLSIWKRRALEAEGKVRHLERVNDHLVKEAQGEHRMGEPVFTALPSPVVNPEFTGATAVPDISALTDLIVDRLIDCSAADDDSIADAETFVYNACRAAMLAQPVSQGCKLPDNVREALTLALQAMEFMGDTLNNIDAVCTEDVEYVTPAFAAVRGLLAAAPEGGNDA